MTTRQTNCSKHAHCEICGTCFPHFSPTPDMFCSEACANVWSKARKAAARRAAQSTNDFDAVWLSLSPATRAALLVA